MNPKSKISNIKNPKLCILTLGVLLCALCSSVEAQHAIKTTRIGYLHGGSRSDFTDKAFQQALRGFGYVDGKNVIVEYRYTGGELDRLPKLVADLVRAKPDIIVAVSDAGTRAAKDASKTIPVVMLGIATDPVESGLVESLARPAGNVTGVTLIAVEITGRRLQLFKEAVPKAARVAVLYDPANRGNIAEAKAVQNASGSLELKVQSLEIRAAGDLDAAFTMLSKERPDGLYVPGGPLMNTHQKRIGVLATCIRLPSVFVRRDAVEAGGLMSYGVDYEDHYRRAAYFVDKILKGAKPADLPVEQPKKFDLTINLKTAKRLGLTIPPNVLARADRIIR